MSADAWPPEDLERVMACPVCGSPERDIARAGLVDRTWGVAPGTWTFWACRACGHWYLDPRPTRESIGRAYRGYYTHPPAGRELGSDADEGPGRRAWTRLRNGYLNTRLGYRLRAASRFGRLIPLVSPGRATWIRRVVCHLRFPATENPTLLDVGCGSGAFMSRMARLGWHVTGIDLDRTAVDRARERGHDARHVSLEESRTELPPGSFDAAVLDHSVEHLHEPSAGLAALYEVVKPGAQVAVATPNVAATNHRLFPRDWVGLSVPTHLALFNAESLETVLLGAGFEQVTAARPASQGGHAFHQSRAIAAGNTLLKAPAPLSAGERIRAYAVGLEERLRVGHAEELAFVARRPE